MKLSLKKIKELYNKAKNDKEFLEEEEAAKKLTPKKIVDFSDGSASGGGVGPLGGK